MSTFIITTRNPGDNDKITVIGVGVYALIARVAAN